MGVVANADRADVTGLDCTVVMSVKMAVSRNGNSFPECLEIPTAFYM